MEKNTAVMTKTVDKAELTAVAGVITMDLDPEALNCPKCLHPLAPPVFQVTSRLKLSSHQIIVRYA
jgi:hypothetical protein